MRSKYKVIFLLLLIPQVLVAQPVENGDKKFHLITFDVYNIEPADDTKHYCSDAGTVRGPFKPDQMRSPKGTEPSFLAAYKQACEFARLPEQVVCDPLLPTGDTPQYVIHCNGSDVPASGSASVPNSDWACRCEKKKTTKGSKQTDDTSSQDNSQPYTLDDLLEEVPELPEILDSLESEY